MIPDWFPIDPPNDAGIFWNNAAFNVIDWFDMIDFAFPSASFILEI